MDHDLDVHLSEERQPVELQDDDGAQDHASHEHGADAAGAYRMTRHWWFNELGMLLHLRCGRVGRYEVYHGRHYIACASCKARNRAPAPSLPYWHAMYGRAS